LGNSNSAFGEQSLVENTAGNFNTGLGVKALVNNSTGNQNIAIGYNAGQANITGNDNILIGTSTNTTLSNLTNSIVIGTNAQVSTSNTVVLGNTQSLKWVFGLATASNPNYALEVGTTTNNGNGAYLTNGGVWTNASSRDFKEGFEDIDGIVLLNKIDSLSITRWKYKGTSELHIGPVAEEFKQLFQLGVQDDNKHISTIDASGIALKAVQVLNKKLADKEEEINELKKQVKSLKEIERKILMIEKKLINIKR
jgi:hypothetical protein